MYPEITALLKELDYHVDRGLCHGFSMRWIEAFLLREEEVFYKRILLIQALASTTTLLKEEVDKLKKKRGLNLNTAEKKLVFLLAFLESMCIYQNPELFKHLFDPKKPINQLRTIDVSEVAGSQAIQKKGLHEVHSIPLFTSPKELITYLTQLQSILDSHKTHAAVLLSNLNHSLAIGYDPKCKKWFRMDINNYDRHSDANRDSRNLNYAITLRQLAQIIFECFDSNTQPFCGFNMQILQLGSPKALLKTELDKLKVETLTTDMVQRSQNLMSLAYFIAEHDHSDLVDLLHTNKVDLNAKNSILWTPITVAVSNGCVRTIVKLLSYNVDIKQILKNGNTLAHIAARSGQAEVIRLLATYKFNFNQRNSTGEYPHIVAANKGYIGAVIAFHEIGFDLSLTNKQGWTIAHAAAKYGHTELLKTLKELGIRIDLKSKSGFTPLFTAVHNQQDDTVKLFAKLGADLNAVSESGKTLLFSAALQGSKSTVRTLLDLHVDINLSLRTNAFKLTIIANDTKDPEVIERMNQYLASKLEIDPEEIFVSPYEIAMILGHKEVASMIKQYSQSRPPRFMFCVFQPSNKNTKNNKRERDENNELKSDIFESSSEKTIIESYHSPTLFTHGKKIKEENDLEAFQFN